VKPSSLQTITLTTLTMIAFASNSILNRLALGKQTIDATSYTAIRLTSGAIMLFVIANLQKKSGESALRGGWLSAAFLFLYAIAFSFAYLSLTAGTGALILFGAVQITMIVVALRSGERPHLWEWLGLFLALGGLVYLVLPGLAAPSPLGSALMTIAGICWGFYTLRGRGSQNPLADTAGNFVYAVPMIILLRLITWNNIHLSAQGILLAILSGAVASGVGYVIWYAALRGLTTTRAAIVQLSVPMIAAWGGVAFLAEHVSVRLLLAGALILGGIALSVLSRRRSALRKSPSAAAKVQ
jgi:drug/metabolite transporter (DMT)-like permease